MRVILESKHAVRQIAAEMYNIECGERRLDADGEPLRPPFAPCPVLSAPNSGAEYRYKPATGAVYYTAGAGFDPSMLAEELRVAMERHGTAHLEGHRIVAVTPAATLRHRGRGDGTTRVRGPGLPAFKAGAAEDACAILPSRMIVFTPVGTHSIVGSELPAISHEAVFSWTIVTASIAVDLIAKTENSFNMTVASILYDHAGIVNAKDATITRLTRAMIKIPPYPGVAIPPAFVNSGPSYIDSDDSDDEPDYMNAKYPGGISIRRGARGKLAAAFTPYPAMVYHYGPMIPAATATWESIAPRVRGAACRTATAAKPAVAKPAAAKPAVAKPAAAMDAKTLAALTNTAAATAATATAATAATATAATATAATATAATATVTDMKTGAVTDVKTGAVTDVKTGAVARDDSADKLCCAGCQVPVCDEVFVIFDAVQPVTGSVLDGVAANPNARYGCPAGERILDTFGAVMCKWCIRYMCSNAAQHLGARVVRTTVPWSAAQAYAGTPFEFLIPMVGPVELVYDADGKELSPSLYIVNPGAANSVIMSYRDDYAHYIGVPDVIGLKIPIVRVGSISAEV